MKITVVTGRGGQIVGTARHVRSGKPSAGHGGPIAGPGQSVHVIDLPRDLKSIEDADELDRKLKPYLPSR